MQATGAEMSEPRALTTPAEALALADNTGERFNEGGLSAACLAYARPLYSVQGLRPDESTTRRLDDSITTLKLPEDPAGGGCEVGAP